MRGMSGAAALARAKQKREAAVAAQAERVEAEQAAIKLANERATERGLVEKTAGESGAAGNLCNKWRKWLGSPHGAAVAARLAGGGAPTVEEAKLFSSWIFFQTNKIIFVLGTRDPRKYDALTPFYNSVFRLRGYNQKSVCGVCVGPRRACCSPNCTAASTCSIPTATSPERGGGNAATS